jgi:hypothetical protein
MKIKNPSYVIRATDLLDASLGRETRHETRNIDRSYDV